MKNFTLNNMTKMGFFSNSLVAKQARKTSFPFKAGIKLLVLVVVMMTSNSYSQAYTQWQGTGNDWNTGANWSSGSAPAYGQLEWRGNGSATSNNNVSNPLSMWRFYFAGTKAYTLTGSKVEFFDYGTQFSWILSDSDQDQTFNLPLEFKDTGARAASIKTRGNGDFIFGSGYNVAVGGNVTDLRIAGNNTSAPIYFNGTVSGSKPIYIGRDEVGNDTAGNTRVFFNGNNSSYSGATYIKAGTLTIPDNSALGSGSLTIGNTGQVGTLAVTDNTTRSQGISIENTTGGSQIDVSSGKTFTLTGALAGGATNTTLFTKVGAGDLVLSATATYNGRLRVSEGKVFVNSNTAISTNNTTSVRAIGLGLDRNAGTVANDVSLLVNNGYTVANSIEVAANLGPNYKRIIGLNGSGTANFTNNIWLQGTLTIKGGSGITTVSGVIESGGGVIVDSGIVDLTATNLYTQATSVTGGVLLVNGSTDVPSAVTVSSGATLGGKGNAKGTVSLSGTLAPGQSASTVGTLTTGAFTFQQDSRYTFNIANTTGTPGTDWDLLTSSGAITINSTSTNPVVIDVVGLATGFANCTSGSWKIAGGTSISGFASNKFSVNTSGFSPTFGGAFSVTQSGNDLYLTYTLANASIASVTGTSPLCVGSTTTYTANTVVLGGGTGSWSSSAPAVATVNATTGLVTGISAGTANIIYTITGGCGGTQSAQKTITITSSTTTIAPSGVQNIPISTNGTTLTVTEGTNTVTSRVWKYGTVSGIYGTSTGVTATTYTPNFGSPGTYYVVCETTYAAPCSVTVASNEVVINVASNTITTGTITGSPFCAGTTGISVPFTYSVAASFPSSIFKAQLSNASGSFASPVDLQTVASDASGSQSISVTIPSGTATGAGYRIRVVSDTPAVLGADNGTNIAISGIPTTAAAGPDQTSSATCGLTSATLAANAPTVGTGAWSIISGTGGSITTPSSNTSTFTGTAGTTYTLRWTISNSPCTASTDDVVITFNQNPTTAAAGPDQTSSATCGLTSATLAANAPTVGTGAWSIISGTGGSVTTPSSNTSTFTGTAGTTYTLRWTISNSPCTASTDDVVITFNQNPTTAAAGPDQTSSATCGLTSVTLAANAPTVGTGAWSIISGTGGSVTTPSSNTSTFTGTAGTTYTLRWTISNSPCTASTDDVVITFNRNPTTAAAGPDQTSSATCGLTSVTLAANAPTVGTGAWSIISGTGGSVTTPSSNTSTFTGTAGTTYTLRWTISNSPCTDSTDDVVITFNRNPTTATNGSTQSICTTGTATLSGNNPTVGTGAWTVVSGPSTSSAQFASTSVYNTVFTPAGGVGSYVIRWTISNAPCTASTADATITVTAVPTPTFTVQPGATACLNTDVTYTTEASKTNYIWTVPGTLNVDYSITSGGLGTGSNTVTLKWLTAGSKTVTINYSSNGCTAASATSSTATTVSTSVGGTATATASSVCLGGSTTITLTGHTGTIQWQRSENSGTNWYSISGATSSTYNTSNLNVATSYRAQVTSGSCGTVNSAVATVTISNVNMSDAGNATYNTTWANAQNDSTTGFGAWAMSASGGGGFFSTGTSDVNNANARSWGMYAGGTGVGNTASATRTVSIGIGNTIAFSMDNGNVTSGGTIGFGLQNATGENLMELYFTGGASFYTLNDNAGAVATSIAYTTSGLDVTLTYTGANTYTVTITGKGGNTVSYTGRTFSTRAGGQVPAQIRFFNAGAGNGSTYDLFFNSLSINNPVITTQPASGTQSYCVGGTPTNLTVAASGTGLTYQWYSNTTASNTGGTSLGSGAQTATYTPQNSTANVRYYYCVVTGACGSTTSRVSGAITVGTGSTAAVLSGTASICSGNSTNLQVAITGGTSPYTVVYSDGTTNFTVNTYVSGTNISVSPTVNTTYSLVSVTSALGCIGTGNSGTPTVTIVSAPTVTLESSALLICAGTTSASLAYTASSGTPNQYSIDYDAAANTAGFTDVTNATLSSSPIGLVIPGSASGTFNATLTVKNTTTGCVSTTYNFTIKTATISGYNLQYWDQAPGPNRACEGGGVFVFGQVYIPGVTDSAGKGLGVYVEFGYNATNNDPSVGANGWNWSSNNTAYDADKDGTKDEYKTNFIPPSPGTYYFAYRYKLNGCDWLYGGYRENWNVVDGPAPWNSITLSNSTFGSGSVIIATAVAAANAGPDITQCSNGTFTMAGNAVASPATGLWTIVSGTASITTAGSATTTVTGVGSGATVTLRWTITNTGCNPTNDTVVLTNNATLSWIGVTSIDWNTASNWSCGVIPTATSIVVIPSGTTYSPSIYQTANGLAKTVTIDAGATLSMSNAYELTLSTAGGFTNNGTFSAGNGTVRFLGTGLIAGSTATTFNNVIIDGGVNFGVRATIAGNLTLNANSFVDTNTPTYTNTSTLIYNTGGTYGRGLEWSATSGAGYPNNIIIQGTTILDVSNGVPGYKKAAGNLTIASGSRFLMNNAKLVSDTDRTVVDGIRGIGVQFLGDISNSGSIWLRGTTDSRLKCDDFVNETGGITSLIAGPSNVGADVEVTGHFTDNGNFGSNERAVFFTGPATQIVSGSATPPFNIDYVVVKKPASSGVVRMDQDLLIGGPTLSAAIVFGSANDIIDLNGKTLTVGTATVASNILGGDLGMFKGSASGSNIILNGAGDIGTISFEQSNPGTSNNIDTFTVNRTGAGGGVTIGSDVNVKTTVTLTAGTINLASANMTVGAAGTIVVTSPSATKMIIASGTGELRKTFSAAGSFTYPIGDNTSTAEYSPVTLNFTAGTFGGYAGVRVVDAIHPNNTVTDIALTRYWPVTSTISSPTCEATFVYLDADIVGDETKYYGGRYKSGWFCLGDVTDATNTIAATVSDFGDFTAGVFNPTAAVISRTGDAGICQGNSSTLQVAITGQVSPYSVVYTDDGGTTTYTLNNYVSGTNIAVMPSTTKTYSIVSVTSGNACIGTGINPATVTVTVGGITTWTGTWSNGAPTSIDSAIISSNYNISANIDACSLTVNSNSIAVIPSGYNVTLSGALTVVEGSRFTLENSANLIQSGTTNPNSGNITAKRDSSLLYLLDYTLWSSPVENQNLYAFSPNTLGNRFYVYNTPTDQYYPISPSDNFALAKAYLIRVPKNYSSYVPAIYNGNFTGKPNSGTITFPLSTAGSGYNAVGNPYPSQVNVHNFIDANPDIDGTLYFWRKRNDMNETSYATLTKSSYTRNAAAGGDTGSEYYNSTNSSSWVINTAQGFIVNATSESDLVFTNAMRRGTNNGNQFFRMAKNAIVEPSQFKLNLTSTDGFFNQMALVYSADYTLGFDRGYEGRNIASTNYLSSIMEGPSGGIFTIQARPEFVSNDIVPLEYKVSKAGTYSITIDSSNGLFVTQDIYIKDKLTNSTYNLKSGSFVFQTEVGKFSDRFEIIYVNPTLSVDQDVFSSNSVIVYKQNQELVIHSGKSIMDNVKVFDVRGRLLISKNNINASQTKFYTGTNNEVLLIKITSDQNEVVNKKIVN